MSPSDPRFTPPPPSDEPDEAPVSEPESDDSSDADRHALRDGLRSRWIAQIDAWLDEALAEESPPDGINPALLEVTRLRSTDDDANDAADLYSFTAALTALTQETKLQGRAFQKLEESVSHGRDAFEAQVLDELRAVRSLAERARKAPVPNASERETIELLLDLHERLDRGLETATRVAAFSKARLESSRLLRLFGKGAIKSILESERELARGCAMTLSRVEEAIEELDVTEIPCLGASFDPQVMKILQVEEPAANEIEPGPKVVVEVFRKGYRWRGDVLRFAEVKVSRNG